MARHWDLQAGCEASSDVLCGGQAGVGIQGTGDLEGPIGCGSDARPGRTQVLMDIGLGSESGTRLCEDP
ncbi:Hypothetical predicted protein, partial [Marmota monax]